jgi:hypothetical protein
MKPTNPTVKVTVLWIGRVDSPMIIFP